MSDKRPDASDSNVRLWCAKMAELGADVLVDAGLLTKANFEKAAAILSEELFVRLCLLDYPPMIDSSRDPNA